MLRCPEPPELERYLTGTAAPGAAVRIREHLTRCSECSSWLDEARRDATLLADVRGALAGEERRAFEREFEALGPHDEPALSRYRVLRELGAGGMGVVYEAEQQNPRRTVALKVLRPGLTSERVLARFEHEGAVLGRLDHPGIARIFEAGTYGAGDDRRPFFAMELVRGRPLDRWALEDQPSLRARLELFARICEAVHHAHQRGVVHRDLKPANILVDESGNPRVLDFGVARAVDTGAQLTHAGELVGTLPYMSPEQIAGDPEEIDTRSDVYSLGVVLFELLAGERPHDVSGLALPAAARKIQERAPTALGSLRREYRGDLETVVATALEQDRERRYSSALAFRDDVLRTLLHEPIAARPPSATYQLAKFARRHRALVAGAFAIFAVLVAGIVGTTSQARRAQGEAERAETVKDLLKNYLVAGDPMTGAKPAGYTLRQTLDDAGDRLDADTDLTPDVEAELRLILGNAYRGMALHAAAERQLERALELCLEHFDPSRGITAESLNSLAILREQQGETDEAERLWRQGLELERRRGFAQSESTATGLINLAGLELDRGSLDEAQHLLDEAREMLAGLSGEHPQLQANLLVRLSRLRRGQGRMDEYEALLHESLPLLAAHYGEAHPFTLAQEYNLAELLFRQGQIEESERKFARLLRSTAEVLGEEHPRTARVHQQLASLRLAAARFDEAEQLARRALEIHLSVLGDHPETATSLCLLGQVLYQRGQLDEGEALLRRAIELRRGFFGDRHVEVARALSSLADCLREMERFEEATEAARESERILAERLGAGHVSLAHARQSLARILWDRGEATEAEPLLESAIETYRAAYGERSPRLVRPLLTLAELREARDEQPAAEDARRAALAVARAAFALDHPTKAECAWRLGTQLARRGDHEAAKELLVDARAQLRRYYGPGHASQRRVSLRLGTTLSSLGELEAAAALYREELDECELGSEPARDHRLRLLEQLARALRARGSFEEALELSFELLDARRGLFGEENAAVAHAKHDLGRAYAGLGELEEAEAWLGDALASSLRARGPRHADVVVVRTELALVLHERGACEEAQRELEQALAVAHERFEPDDARLGRALRASGRCLAGLGRAGEAESALLEAHATLSLALHERDPALDELLRELVLFYEETDRPDEARRWREGAR